MPPHRPRLVVLAVLALVAALLIGPAQASARGSACPFSSVRAGVLPAPLLQEATLCLVNRARARRGLRRLRSSRSLEIAARGHVREMVRKRYFAHTSRAGLTFVARIRRTGYFRGTRRWAAGEIIAWGTRERSTPRAIVRAWLRSPPHRHNLLGRKWREIGVGVSGGSPAGYRFEAATYATEFGVRR